MKKAFTLAETLITLVIVGVIAALTIPTLIDKLEENHFKSQYKKTFATFSQALKLASMKDCYEAQPSGSSWSSSECLVLELRTAKICTAEEACWTQSPVKGLNGSDISEYDFKIGDCINEGARILSDGTVISLNVVVSPNASRIYKYYTIDLNGLKGPNTLGRDIHVLIVEANVSQIRPVLKPYFSQTYSLGYPNIGVNSIINSGCVGLSDTTANNRGYTCGAKWLINN